MTPTVRFAGLLLTAGVAVAVTASAQPPEGGPRPAFRAPLRGALDANHDMELDADEITKAPEALKSLDKNGDGKIDREELRPPMGPPPRERESGDGPPRREPGRRDAGPSGDRPGPERFVARAKEFDADGDGKLDQDELRKFGEAMAERMRAGRGPGDRGPGGDGERPERPRPPE
jgi:hypothetical protein